MTYAVVVGGGSKGERCAQEELDRSGIGSNEILEYIEENCKCFFHIFNCLFQLSDMILTRYFNMHF